MTTSGKKEPEPSAADAAKAQGTVEAAAAKVKEAKEIAEDAYIYGYSLITTEVTPPPGPTFPKTYSLIDLVRLPW